MGLLEERLTNLWLREAEMMSAAGLTAETRQIHSSMGVTVKAPMMISGALLKPGRYVFQGPDPGCHPNQVKHF